MQMRCLEVRGEQSFIFEAFSMAGGKAPSSAIPLTGRVRRTPQGARWHRGREHGPEESPGRRAHGSRGRGCGTAPAAAVSPTPARARTSTAGTSSQSQPAGSGRGTDPLWGAPALPPLTAAPPPPGLVSLPPRLTGRGGRRSSPRAAGTGDCWPSPRGSARSSSSSSSRRRRRRQAQPHRARAALHLPRRPPADSSPRTALTPGSPWWTPRSRRPAAAPTPLPARPRRPGSGPGVTDGRAAPRESESRPPTPPRTHCAPPARNYISRRAPRRDLLRPVPAGADGS